MQSTNSFSKKSVGSIAVAALLIFGVYTIMPMTPAAYAQATVTITTSADAHNNRFYGPALLEVMFQSSQHAADNNQGNAQVTVEAFGTSQTIQLTETSTTSGIFLMYVKVDGDNAAGEAPLAPANPFSDEYSYLVVGPAGADDGYPNSAHLLQTTNVAEGGTIQFSFGGVTKTVTYDDTPATLTLDRTNYGPGATIYARIYDPDINLDPTDTNTIEESDAFELLTGADTPGTPITFTETGTNTARFEAALTAGALASGSQGRSLTANDYSDFEGATGAEVVSTGTQRGSSSASYVVQVVSGAIQPLANMTYAGELPLLILDSDRNLNSKTQETFSGDLVVNHVLANGATDSTDFDLREKTPSSNELVPAYGQDRIRLTFKESTSATAGTIFIRPGVNVQLQYDDANPNQITSSMTLSITNTAPTLEIDKSSVGKSSTVTLTMTDRELNDDSSIIESYSVSYPEGQPTSDANGMVAFTVDGTQVEVFSLRTHLNGSPITLANPFTVTFIETGPNTGVFTAEIDLTELDAAFAGTFTDGDILNFRVTDRLHSSNQPQASVTTTVGIEKPTMSVDRTTLPVPRDPDADNNALGTNEDDVSNLGPISFELTIVDPARNNSTLIEEVLQPVDTQDAVQLFEFDTEGTSNARLVMTLTPAPGTSFSNLNMIEISEAITETGFNTGVFVGKVTVHAHQNDIPAWIGAKLKIDYKGLDSSAGATSDDASSITLTFTSRQAVLTTDSSVVVSGGDITFNVSDADANRDPTEEDSVKVRIVWVDANGVAQDEWLELEETDVNTGVFSKTVTVGDDSIGGVTFSVAPDEEIDVFYYDGTPNIPATQANWPSLTSSTVRHERTLVSASASGALSIGAEGAVGPSAEIEVTVIDTDENTNPNTRQRITAKVTIATDRGVVEELELEETEPNSARFVGTLKLNPSTGTASSQSGTETTIDVLPGDVVSVRYEDEKDADGRRTTISQQFTVTSVDPEITLDKDSYGAGEQMTITLADLDADVDPDSNDILNVRVTSTSDLVGLSSVQLIETGPNTGVFVGTVTLTNQFSSGSLLVRNGDTITIRYTDQYPADYKDRIDAGGVLTKDFLVTVQVGDSVIDSVEPSAPRVTDAQGNQVSQVLAGQQVVLSSTIQNKENTSGPYAAIVEVRDSNGVTVYLQWQTGTLPANGSTNVGVSWTPDMPDTYTIRVFVLSSLSNPQILSEIVTSTVNVS